jgi:hypothetical protein
MATPGGSWQIVQPYSSVATYSWSTTAAPATGRVQPLGVGARRKRQRSFREQKRWDTYSSGTYTLTSKACSGVACRVASHVRRDLNDGHADGQRRRQS